MLGREDILDLMMENAERMTSECKCTNVEKRIPTFNSTNVRRELHLRAIKDEHVEFTIELYMLLEKSQWTQHIRGINEEGYQRFKGQVLLGVCKL